MSILWKKISFDELILESESLGQYIKKLEQKYREYKVFTQTQSKVKVMNQTLQLMSELHSDDMQTRHWEELSEETNSIIKQDDAQFCFRDLFKLELHR